MRKPTWDGWDAASQIPSVGDDPIGWILFGVGIVLLLPILLVVLLFSLELGLVLLLVPFAMAGQVAGLLPWQIALRSVDGEKRYVSVTGTRKMLEARRYYRSLRA